MRVGLLLVTVAGGSAYNFQFRQQRNPSLANPGTYAESVAQLTHVQQVAELERLCSSLSVNRLAQPEELRLLRQELARMKSEGALSQSIDDPVAELRRCHQLRALEMAERVAAEAAEVVVAEAAAAAAAEAAAAHAARAAETEARKTADAAVAAVAAEAKARAEAKAAAAAAAATAAAAAAETAAAETAAAETAAAETAAAAAEAAAAAAEAVAAPPEQQISGAAEVAVPPEVAYTLQVEREFGRDPRLGPPPPPTLASPLAACPAELPSPHRHCPAVDHDGTREAGEGPLHTLTSHRSPLTPRPSASPAPPWITENKAMLAELALLSSAQPQPAYASSSSAVQPMLTLEHFEAALERARPHNRLVVIKFYQATTGPDHSPRPPP